MIGLALSSTVAQAKAKNNESGFFQSKKAQLFVTGIIAGMPCKVQSCLCKREKKLEKKHEGKRKKDKKHKPKINLNLWKLYPRFNAGGAAMAFLLAVH